MDSDDEEPVIEVVREVRRPPKAPKVKPTTEVYVEAARKLKDVTEKKTLSLKSAQAFTKEEKKYMKIMRDVRKIVIVSFI